MQMEVLRFSDLLKKASEKASDVLQSLGIRDPVGFVGKDGELIYSKNNVCVHGLGCSEETKHCPGYLSVVCQKNEATGSTLLLQWCPNDSLQKHPGRLASLSPRLGQTSAECTERLRQHLNDSQRNQRKQKSISPDKLTPTADSHSHGNETAQGKSIQPAHGIDHPLKTTRYHEEGDTPTTSEEDAELSPEEADSQANISSSPYSSAGENDEDRTTRDSLQHAGSSVLKTLKDYEQLNESPEKFAEQHNMALPDQGSSEAADQCEPISAQQAALASNSGGKPDSSMFVADLGRLKVLRLFFSNPEATCGQLVIANHQRQYKIFYFHNDGLDKLAHIFEQWNVLRSKGSKSMEKPEDGYLHFSVLRPQLRKMDLHPEEGLYERVTWSFWRSCINVDKIVDDELIRKAIFFSSIDPSLRREAWPFLLDVYPWQSTREQREHIRNDLFIEYQNLKKKRLKKAGQLSKAWRSVEQSIDKDVVRTDRDKPFYAGEGNPNLGLMRDILLNYAIFAPKVAYVQGMSDLLSPLLPVLHEEVDTFWCFVGLMKRTVSVGGARDELCFENNLELLVALVQLMYPELFAYLESLGKDSMQLLFAHRWLLLWFKREFLADEAMCIWEASWTGYGTPYFHLFVALAIMTLYGGSVLRERMMHDEVLLYFNSLALHMDVKIVLTKARGLLYHFRRLETIPCTLVALCDFQTSSAWDSLSQPRIVCTRTHDMANMCPYNESATA
uniref:Rab-GAP TBC domain-containing protein n=1 Tax=Trichuris muris TaxID=70415 RepID=A0A5S6QHU0_TRIMR